MEALAWWVQKKLFFQPSHGFRLLLWIPEPSGMVLGWLWDGFGWFWDGLRVFQTNFRNFCSSDVSCSACHVGPHEFSVIIQFTLRHQRWHLRDVPLQSDSPLHKYVSHHTITHRNIVKSTPPSRPPRTDTHQHNTCRHTHTNTRRLESFHIAGQVSNSTGSSSDFPRSSPLGLWCRQMVQKDSRTSRSSVNARHFPAVEPGSLEHKQREVRVCVVCLCCVLCGVCCGGCALTKTRWIWTETKQ